MIFTVWPSTLKCSEVIVVGSAGTWSNCPALVDSKLSNLASFSAWIFASSRLSCNFLFRDIAVWKVCWEDKFSGRGLHSVFSFFFFFFLEHRPQLQLWAKIHFGFAFPCTPTLSAWWPLMLECFSFGGQFYFLFFFSRLFSFFVFFFPNSKYNVALVFWSLFLFQHCRGIGFLAFSDKFLFAGSFTHDWFFSFRILLLWLVLLAGDSLLLVFSAPLHEFLFLKCCCSLLPLPAQLLRFPRILIFSSLHLSQTIVCGDGSGSSGWVPLPLECLSLSGNALPMSGISFSWGLLLSSNSIFSLSSTEGWDSLAGAASLFSLPSSLSINVSWLSMVMTASLLVPFFFFLILVTFTLLQLFVESLLSFVSLGLLLCIQQRLGGTVALFAESWVILSLLLTLPPRWHSHWRDLLFLYWQFNDFEHVNCSLVWQNLSCCILKNICSTTCLLDYFKWSFILCIPFARSGIINHHYSCSWLKWFHLLPFIQSQFLSFLDIFCLIINPRNDCLFYFKPLLCLWPMCSFDVSDRLHIQEINWESWELRLERQFSNCSNHWSVDLGTGKTWAWVLGSSQSLRGTPLGAKESCHWSDNSGERMVPLLGVPFWGWGPD